MIASSFDPRDVAQVAECLLYDYPDVSESDWDACANARARSVVSRAYYAAFLELKRRLLLARQWKAFPAVDVHKKLRVAVVLGLAPSHALAQLLKELSRQRKDADYELGVGVSMQRAERLYDMAVDAIELVEQLPDAQIRKIADELADIESARTDYRRHAGL